MRLKWKAPFSRPRLSVRTLVTAICALAIVVAAGAIGSRALGVLYQSKILDLRAILFLDLEQSAYRLSEAIAALPGATGSGVPDALFRVAAGGALTAERGRLPEARTLADLGFETAPAGAPVEIANRLTLLGGQIYLAADGPGAASPRRLSLYKIPPALVTDVFPSSRPETVVYVLNRAGRLIYSTSDAVVPSDATNRPLVQQFLKAPFRQAQMAIDGDGRAAFGFYQEGPKTNLVLFAETDRRVAVGQVRTILRDLTLVAALILIVAVILLQFPLLLITRPLNELADMARGIGRGDFRVRQASKGFGEMAALAGAFTEMAGALGARDKAYAATVGEHVARVRLANERAVARTLQRQLDSIKNAPPASALDIAVLYEPAPEIAGDWFGHAFDAARQETVVMVADVAGRGVAAVTLSAVISVLFAEETRTPGAGFDLPRLMGRLNAALYDFGSGTATATAVILKYEATNRTLSWLGAGHPPPLILSGTARVLRHDGRSSALLGLEPDWQGRLQSCAARPGDVFVLCTDGLFGSAPGAKQVSRRRLARILQTTTAASAAAMIAALQEGLPKPAAGAARDDDACLIVGRLG